MKTCIDKKNDEVETVCPSMYKTEIQSWKHEHKGASFCEMGADFVPRECRLYYQNEMKL